LIRLKKLKYIGIKSRAVAQIFDAIILAAVSIFLGYGVAFLVGSATETGLYMEGVTTAVWFTLSILVGIIYFTFFEAHTGQTFGKMIVGIKVIHEDGSNLNYSSSFVRNFLRVIDGLIFYMIGIVFIIRSNKKQRLGDKIAKTVVVKTKHR